MHSNRQHSLQVCGHNIGGTETHYRITVMGASCVGKSAIISQFLFETFLSEYNETIEELYRREYDLNGAKLTLDILDTAGTHEFPAMRKLAIATSDAFLLVYSLDDDSSFDEVKALREQIVTEKNDPSVPIVIVGNKVDVCAERRIIEKETAESIACVEWGCGYIEASAKDNINIVGIFMEMLRLCKLPYASALPVPVSTKRKRFSAPTLSLSRVLSPTHKHPKRHSCTIS